MLTIFLNNNKIIFNSMNKWIMLFFIIVSQQAYADSFYEKHKGLVDDIFHAADQVKVPRMALLAICFTESSLNTHLRLNHKDGHSHSYGICQIKLGTAMYMDEVFGAVIPITAKRLKIHAINAFYAAEYLKYQLNRYDNNVYLAADAYNKHNAIGIRTKYVKKFIKNIVMLARQDYGNKDSRLCDNGKCEIRSGYGRAFTFTGWEFRASN